MPSTTRNIAVPAYQRIQRGIRKRIEAGDLRTGEAVPSERDLAKIHKVSLMTARHALASLEREGVVKRTRLGPRETVAKTEATEPDEDEE